MAEAEMLAFIGTQCVGSDQGIYAASLDRATGALRPIGMVAAVERPTWVSIDAERGLLYATNEVGNQGDCIGDVLSFAIDRESGALRPISCTASAGGGPTHLALAPDGQTLFVANFGGGQVSAMPIASDGTLGEPSSVRTNSGSGPHRRQKGPHAHGVILDPSRRFLLAPDMGADRVFVYRYDGARKLLLDHTPPFAELPPGAGPRLCLFGVGGRFVYLLTELSAEIFVFAWDAEGGLLRMLQHLPLDPVGHSGPTSAAAFTMSEDGRYIYASNRIRNTIHVYRADRDGGLLAEVQVIEAGGSKPWGASIAPGGGWLLLANQGSDEVKVFQIDRDSGHLVPTGARLGVPTPTSVALIPRKLM